MWMLFAVLCLQASPDTLWTETGEGWEFTVVYPAIMEQYPELETILEDYASGQVEEFKRQFSEYGLDDPFLHGWVLDLNFVHEPSPRGMICVTAWRWDYTGGAHGNMWTRAFLFSVGENRLMDTVELLGGEERFTSFAEAVVEYLQSDGFYDNEWVARGAGPDPGNYHTVIPVPGEDCGIEGYTVIFPPYQVDCYATGPVEVFVPAEWEEDSPREMR